MLNKFLERQKVVFFPLTVLAEIHFIGTKLTSLVIMWIKRTQLGNRKIHSSDSTYCFD